MRFNLRGCEAKLSEMNVHFPYFEVKHQQVKVDKSEIQVPDVFQGFGMPGIEHTLCVEMEQARFLFEQVRHVLHAKGVVWKGAGNGLCQFKVVFRQLLPRGFPGGGSWFPA